jgi:hypothetical protein
VRQEQEVQTDVRVTRVEGSGSSKSTNADEASWREYFADPDLWWDNRNNKANPKAPDFKHKVTGRTLWIQGWYTPLWVKERFPKVE